MDEKERPNNTYRRFRKSVRLDKTNRLSASQEIPRILWNPNVHYRNSPVPANCPYREPARSCPCPHIPFPEDPSQFENLLSTKFW